MLMSFFKALFINLCYVKVYAINALKIIVFDMFKK